MKVCARRLMAAVFGLTLTVTAAGTANSATTSGFILSANAKLESATGTPIPVTGQHAKLGAKGSYLEARVSGSGRVVIGAVSSYCTGYPIISVAVDGRLLGSDTLTSTSNYGAHYFGSSIVSGDHLVRVTMVNDLFVIGKCDANAYISTVNMESANSVSTAPALATSPTALATSSTALATSSTAKPGSGNTGVPSGTALKIHYGDLTIRTPGTVIDSMDVRGYVSVQADNVTIRKSIIRGGAAATTNRALVAAWWGYKNLIVEDSTLVAANRSLRIDGLSGSGITARRLNIYGVVDGVKVIGNDFSISGSWIHDTIHSTSDPNQSDGKTHDDSVQIEGGSNIRITANAMEDAHNAAIMVTQNRSSTSNLAVRGNWLKDGACTVNLTESKRGPIYGSAIESNRFGPGYYGFTCALRKPKTSPVSTSGNVWDATSQAVSLQIF